MYKILMSEQFAISIFAVTYFITSIFILGRLRERKKQKRDKFFNTLLDGLKLDLVKSSDDLVNIYKGVTNLSGENLSYRYGLNTWLRQFLVEIINEQSVLELSTEDIHKFKSKICEFIKNNDEISPFSDLPETERSILNDIGAFLANNDSDSIKRKIKELGSIIQTRYEEHKKLERNNKWSIPLAVIGLILSLVLGIIPIFVD